MCKREGNMMTTLKGKVKVEKRKNNGEHRANSSSTSLCRVFHLNRIERPKWGDTCQSDFSVQVFQPEHGGCWKEPLKVHITPDTGSTIEEKREDG